MKILDKIKNLLGPKREPDAARGEAPKASPVEWVWREYDPTDNEKQPKRNGWYAVVYGTRCQIKWYDKRANAFSKVPLNYPVEYYYILPPLPQGNRPKK